MLNKERLQKLTHQAISRAFFQGLKSDQPDLEDRLRQIVVHLVAEDGPDWQRDRELLLKRVLAAVAEDEPDRLIKVVNEICDCDPHDPKCVDACPIGALTKDQGGRCATDRALCIDCTLCVDICHSGAMVERTECLRLVDMVEQRESRPLYAIIAPAFAGQFGRVWDGQVRNALLRLGFSDVYEVAMAADIITLREAKEYVDRIDHGEDFMITSCCCPAFIKLVEKHQPGSTRLVSDSVSPMIAMGRLLKARQPDCRVVFIGPCLAKRAEARLPELRDAIDGVLTFKETASLFQAAGILVDEQEDEGPLTDASHDGRIYAHTGGVSEAIARAIKQLRPDLVINAVKGNGLKQCREILQAIEGGERSANFMEGMACPGGCLGGPGTIVKVDQAVPYLSEHASQAPAFAASENDRAVRWIDEFGGQVNFHTKHVDLPAKQEARS